MELIDKDKIEEAALSADEELDKIPDAYKFSPTDNFVAGFKSGVSFAQNELTPLFCEFIIWSFKSKYTMIEYSSDLWYNKDEDFGVKTTQQLFELWIEERNTL